MAEPLIILKWLVSEVSKWSSETSFVIEIIGKGGLPE
jgi:hypothetical protein